MLSLTSSYLLSTRNIFKLSLFINLYSFFHFSAIPVTVPTWLSVLHLISRGPGQVGPWRQASIHGRQRSQGLMLFSDHLEIIDIWLIINALETGRSILTVWIHVYNSCVTEHTCCMTTHIHKQHTTHFQHDVEVTQKQINNNKRF